MFKFIFQYLYYVTFVTLFFIPSLANAQIHIKAFKGITNYFNQKHYSLTLGKALLDTNILYNERFYGIYNIGYTKEGLRKPILDKNGDSLWNVVKILFPSPTGNLNAETQGNANLGRYIRDPKTVAQLMYFAKNIREGKNYSVKEINELATEVLNSLQNNLKPSIKNNLKKQSIIPLFNAIEEAVQLEKANKSPYPQHFTEGVISAFFCEKFDTQSHIWQLIDELKQMDHTQSSLNPIINDSLPLPQKIMIEETDENNAAQKVYYEENLFKYEDLEKIAQKATNERDYDDIYNLANADIFDMQTPYKAGIPLISNGSTYYYDRKTSKYNLQETFADCAETGIRHFINMLLFNPETVQFDLSFVTRHLQINDPNNPYFKNFKQFYEKQTPLLANASNIAIRSLWNTVVADLNIENDQLNIAYEKDNNELNPGFINLMYVCQKIFSLPLLPMPKDNFDKQKEWIENSLALLVQTVNPRKIIDVNLNDLKKTHKDISGTALFTVKDTETKEALFSYEFHAKEGVHSEIKSLQSLKKIQQLIDYSPFLKQFDDLLHEAESDEVLRLFIQKQLPQHPFYQLFNTNLDDTYRRIETLERIAQSYSQWQQNFIPKDDFSKFIIKVLDNIFQNTSWNEESTLNKVSPIIKSLSQLDDFSSVIKEQVKGIKFVSIQENNEIILDKFTALTYLYFENLNVKRIGENDLKPIAHSIQKLSLRESTIEELNLFGLNKLVDLDIVSTFHLKEITLNKGLNSLENVSVWNSGVKEINLVDLPKLKTLNISFTPHLKKLNLGEGLNALTEIGLGDLELEEVDFSRLSKLERIGLINTRNLKKLDLGKGLESLAEIDIWNPYIQEIKLADLPKFRKLNLVNTMNIKKIDLGKGMDSLADLDLKNIDIQEIRLSNNPLMNHKNLEEFGFNFSAVTDLYLEDFNEFKELDLSRMVNLRSVVLKGKFTGLKTIDFGDLPRLQHFEGFDNFNEQNISMKNIHRLPIDFNQ